MVRACPGGSLLVDVDPLLGMTPGVAQFYRRCIAAGVRRADGAVVCGSQKELALALQLSQGTVASHVSALQAAGLVVQRVPVMVLANDGQAALAEPVNAEPASFEDVIVKLAAVIGSCPSSAAIAQLGQALITLATERDGAATVSREAATRSRRLETQRRPRLFVCILQSLGFLKGR